MRFGGVDEPTTEEEKGREGGRDEFELSFQLAIPLGGYLLTSPVLRSCIVSMFDDDEPVI